MWKKELNELKKEENIVERAFNIHLWYFRTQAFKDGNKRVANFITNHELIKNSAGLFTVPDDMCNKYKILLVKFYETGDSKEIKEFMYNNCYVYDNSGLPFSIKFESN